MAPATARSRPAWRYAAPARLIHWLSAVLLAGMAGWGWYMMSIEDEPGAGWYFGIHQSVGLLVALLVVLRIVWRATHRPAPLPARMPAWETRLARATQALMYLLLVATPLSGLAGSQFSEDGMSFFGRSLPRLVPASHDLAESFFGIHETLVWLLVTLVVLHVLGALKHLWLHRDGVFQRMV